MAASDSPVPSWELVGSPPFAAPSSSSSTGNSNPTPHVLPSDANTSFGERAVSAAGAAVLSAVLVNPLDVAKTRLQAQAAGVPYSPQYQHDFHSHMAPFMQKKLMYTEIRCSPSCTRVGPFGTEAVCTLDCFQYKGTLDVLYKVVKQEGLSRLWRGTNAGLALAIPTVGIYLPCYDLFLNQIEGFTTKNAPIVTPYAPLIAGSVSRSLACIACSPIELARTRMQAFKDFKSKGKPPGIRKTLVGVLSIGHSNNLQNLQGYRLLWTGVGAQLARDVPFSAICWSILEPARRKLLSYADDEGSATSVLRANFVSGFMAGTVAAGVTCPLDVAKTRRQIEKDPSRVLNMTTRQTLVEVWRERGLRGLFTGVGPRMGRAGPSVGIVVSFYEVVKYVLHQRHACNYG